MSAGPALLAADGLTKHFPIRGGILQRRIGEVRAVDNVSFEIRRGEVLGLVGESGSGKTTVGRAVLGLTALTDGRVRFDGAEIGNLSPEARVRYRQRAGIIFQDPFASLNPRMRVDALVGEGLAIHGIGTSRDRRERVAELLTRVGLSADHMGRYPHEFSGGQRQRIGIARALAPGPDFLVADEPVSALDVSVQAQVINLLKDLQQELNLSLLFIAHDLSVVEYVSDRVAVMYLGRLMEIGPASRIYTVPKHPYTEALLSAAPMPDPDADRRRIILEGDVPSPANPPSGCVFRTRCPYALPECAETVPQPMAVAPGHLKACIRDDIL